MVTIKPFKATILNPEISNREMFVCPVYDTIDEAKYARYGSEKNNVVNITTCKSGIGNQEFINNSKKNLTRFIQEGILEEREHSALYIYGIRYSLPEDILVQIPDSAKRAVYFAFGLVALVKVGEMSIVGHERIFEKHATERYELMKAISMNFAPIVSEYNMPGHDINNILENFLGFKRPDLILREDRPPVVDIILNGTRHLLWEITDPNIIQQIQKLLADRKVLILDGHHRYDAAYKLCKQDGVEYTMMMFMEGGDRALLLLPWHRCVRRLDVSQIEAQVDKYYDVLWKGVKNDDIFNNLLHTRDDMYDIRVGMYNGSEFSVLMAHKDKVKRLSDKLGEKVGLDFISLNEWIIEPILNGNNADDIVFVDSVAESVRKVDTQGFELAFLMKPLAIEDVEYKAHVEMKHFPQKSTLFMPKVAEGILMRRFEV